MLILVILALLGLMIWSIHKLNTCESYDDEGWICLIITSGFGLMIATISFFIVLGIVVNGAVIDEEIAVLGERNTEINTSLTEMVENYTNYERSTYEKLKISDITVVLQAYPDLKAQPLVEQQINTYVENQNEITKKKQEKVRLKVKRWWLTFNIGE